MRCSRSNSSAIAATAAAGPAAAPRPSLDAIWRALDAVPDPEIPVVSVIELGIVRGRRWDAADPPTLVVHRDADLFRLSRDRAHHGRDPRRARGGRGRARSPRDAARPGVDDGLDGAGGAGESCAPIGIAPPVPVPSPRPSTSRAQPAASARRAAVACPALRLDAHGAGLAVRLDRLQGAVPLRRLPRAVRLLQAALTSDAQAWQGNPATLDVTGSRLPRHLAS